MFSRLKRGRPASTGTGQQPTPSSLKPGKPVKTNYASNPVPIPPTFLTTAPPDGQPVVLSQIDFSTSPLPKYTGCYAVVLDNVLSPSECETLLRLAEASVPKQPSWTGGESNGDGAEEASGDGAEVDPWQPALVNIGGGYEVLSPEYRNSDRIIWDQQTIVDRLWERCLAGAPELKEKLEVVEQDFVVLGPSRRDGVQRWEFRRLNDRMRFLRYGKGQFFRPHCDAAYREPGKDIKTLFTLHLYLNDSKQTVGEEAELEGGATSFLSADEKKKMDVDPKAGRVLIFQHRNLYHSGDDVVAGIKYTMRTDIMYELVPVQEDTSVGEVGAKGS